MAFGSHMNGAALSRRIFERVNLESSTLSPFTSPVCASGILK
jgi:hypothetical protein